MTTLLEIPLREATPHAISDWQARYPDATLRIETDIRLPAKDMDEAKFWAIIDQLDRRQEDRSRILAPAIEALSQFSPADIQHFHNLLNEKLYALDGRRFAEQLGSNRYPPAAGGHFSVDDFLYARCGVVAQGRRFYEQVLHDPTRTPKEFTFEQLLYLPEKAWALKTGRDNYDHVPETWCETFSNPEGWPGITPIKVRLQNA